MAKRFRLRLSRVIPSFQSCRSKDAFSATMPPSSSSLDSNNTVVPSFFKLPPVNLHTPSPHPPPSKPSSSSSSIKHHVNSALASIGCGAFRSSRSAAADISLTAKVDVRSKPSLSPPTPEFHWGKEEKWHVVAKIYDEDADYNTTPRRKIYTSSVSGGSENEDCFLSPALHSTDETRKKKRRVKKKRILTPRIRISTSSADSGLFSSGGLDDDDDDDGRIVDEETETLVSSSRSLSTDSWSELFNVPHNQLEPIRESPFSFRARKVRNKVKKAKRSSCVSTSNIIGSSSGRKSSELMTLSPARLSRFQWLIPCSVEGKVRESFAVVKKSEDPYEDFRRSMMEMILEKQMFEEKDLEQLLHCFLSLNARQHHGVIVQAFSEIWEALFCARRRRSMNRSSLS